MDTCCSHDAQKSASENVFVQYRPLIVIVSLLTLSVAAILAAAYVETGTLQWTNAMRNFMAGFFLVFSGLKLLDIKGFARSYAMYDLLASRFSGYGYLYPFLELGLGLAYLIDFFPHETNIATFILMTFSGMGVAQSLIRKKEFQCACLGTLLKVPLTKVALVEDFGMALMALIMILAH